MFENTSRNRNGYSSQDTLYSHIQLLCCTLAFFSGLTTKFVFFGTKLRICIFVTKLNIFRRTANVCSSASADRGGTYVCIGHAGPVTPVRRLCGVDCGLLVKLAVCKILQFVGGLVLGCINVCMFANFWFVFANLIEKATQVTIFWNLARNPEKNSSKIRRKNAKFELFAI